MKQYIEEAVKSALATLSLPVVPVSVVATGDPSHGDYATNVVFSLSKELKKSPHEVADLICSELRTMNYELLEKVEVAGNGFINFTLSNKALISNVISVGHSRLDRESDPRLHEDDASNRQNDTSTSSVRASAVQKVMIEFTDPNPFKEFHIGHLYSNIVGESIARLVESTGAEVKRVTYQGDVGLHVAKSIYGMQEKMQAENLSLETLGQRSLVDKVRFLGQSYALGSAAFEEDELAKQAVIDLNKKVYRKDPEIVEIYTTGRQWSLEYFEIIYARLGSKFWKNYFESDAGPIGIDLVKEYLGKGIFRESQGAIIFPGEEYGLHTRVFINSIGLPTYEAKELGLAPTKYKDYKYDLSIIVTGNEINEYFKVLLKALSIIYPDLSEKTKHIGHGMVRLPEGKMASRKGNVITGEWLLDEAVKRAQQKIKESKAAASTSNVAVANAVNGIDESVSTSNVEDSENIAEIVGVGAVKWALLKSSIGKDIEFSFEESISFEGNSGPYIQYTFVRTQSVLAKAGISNDKYQMPNKQIDWKFDIGDLTFEIEERGLLVLLSRYSDTVTEAAEKFAPHLVTTYLFELSQSFNNFYQKHSILKPTSHIVGHPHENEDPDSRVHGNDTEVTRAFRLALTAKVGETLRNGLHLLGIKTPERM